MRLADFIVSNMDKILSEWDSFARSLGPAADQMSASALRDHAKPILQAIVEDMAAPVTPREQLEKSQVVTDVQTDTAAGTHGTLRHISGFSLLQLTAEYRALRATVFRLWLPQIKDFNEGVSSDMVRFNETIDQALAESVLTYSDQGERTRDTFLAILGHDLRSPLATVSMAGDLLIRHGEQTVDVESIGLRIRRSVATMTTMVNDLLEYARTQLGGMIPISPEIGDMVRTCNEAVEDARAANPECGFESAAEGDLTCNFDAPRLQQVLSNLLNNAAQYSKRGHPVTLVARGGPDSVVLRVKNLGEPIPGASLQAIFNPLVQLRADDDARGRPATSIGLGLFIAREITVAHGGTISVESDETTGTVFTVSIPKSLSGHEFGRVHMRRAG